MVVYLSLQTDTIAHAKTGRFAKKSQGSRTDRGLESFFNGSGRGDVLSCNRIVPMIAAL